MPLALKTAILWQPKSWAKFRQVLLAPPAKLIAMSGEPSTRERLSSRQSIQVALHVHTTIYFVYSFLTFSLSTDDNSNAGPSHDYEVKETIGAGKNGLRVEVSLKYRRLLVQKLAKESLLSTKDYDAFRLALIDRVQCMLVTWDVPEGFRIG